MAEGGPNPPDLETQKNEINVLIKKPLKKGDTWFLIDNRWFKLWKKYVGYDSWDTFNVGEQSSHPGPIDNGPLFKDNESGELKEHLIDELDYVLVPGEAWEKLVTWYKSVDGQEPIARKVVEHGMFVKNCKVEVYLVEFKLCQNSDLNNWVCQKFSKADTIDHIEQEMRKLFNISKDKETRLWNKYMSNTYEQLNKKDSTVQDAGLYQSQVLVIEQINDDGTWPRHVKSTNNSVSYSSSPSSSSPEGKNGGATSKTTRNYTSFNYPSNYNSYDYNSGGIGNVQPGLCGLSNLGNTCFMNSALQCMSNTPPLTRYFLEDRYLEELNLDNPLGMKGEIAKSYAELIKQMWSGRYSYTVPRNFKTQVGRFAPQFSGYQQQDSQELMAFLLDGLHEDLNRIKKKPYIELKDADGRPDPEVAREAWENYRKRNDSIIVDIFHGLLKSTLVCPECEKISVTFDPFCYLSLPLPIKKERQMDVFFIYFDPMKKPVKFKLTVPKMGIVSDLCAALSKFTNIPPDKMLVTDVYNHRFHKLFPTEEILNHILDKDDIFVYEVPFITADDPELVLLPVYLREERPPSQYNYSKPPQLFGQPLLIPIPRKNCTYDILYDLIFKKMARFVRIPDDNNEWWIDSVDMEKVNGEIEINNDNDSEEDSQRDELEDTAPHEDSVDLVSDEQIEEDNRKHHLFTIHFVNSCGNSELDGLKDDGKPIKFTNRMYIAIDWKVLAKNHFYDEKAAEEYEQHESTYHKHTQKKQVIQLDECLQLFTTTEKLGAEDPWFCPSCSKHQQATKKFDLWMLPKILVIHLKRFSYNRYWRDKIDTLVEFPARNLNMSKYIINSSHGPVVYDLIAVSNHYGGMGGGHYTAYAANKDDEHWYYFDDSSVSPSSEDVVISKAAYVLFYMLRDAQASLNIMRPHNSTLPAAAGAPMNCNDSGINSSDEDDSMDTN